MAKNTGIDSNSFYGNQSNYPKKYSKKNKYSSIGDENQMPDIKTSKYDINRTPAKLGLKSYLNHSSRNRYNRITTNELNYITNGFNKNRFNGWKSSSNSSIEYPNGNRVRLDMKPSLLKTPILENCETPPKDTQRSDQKITKFFTNKTKSVFDSNNEKISNINNNEVISCSPLTFKDNIETSDNCLTPKRHSFEKSLESVNEVNKRLFSSDFNDLEENHLNGMENIEWSPLASPVVLEANTPIGLKNLGNTCYMNSIVQSLFALKFFVEDLEMKFNEQKIFCDQIISFSMTEKLLNLYNQYNGLRTRDENSSFDSLNSNLLDLKQCVGEKSPPFLSGCQQDAAEFFNYIIESISEEFELCPQSEDKKNPIWRNFSLETGGSLLCQSCKTTTNLLNEKYNALYLRIPEDHKLETAVEDFLKDETTSHECAHCGNNNNVLSKYFAKRSKILFLQLARYTQEGSKRTEPIELPLQIYLSTKPQFSQQFMIAPSPLATPYRTKLQNIKYCIKSSVVRKINFDNSFGEQNNENISTLQTNESILSDSQINESKQLTNSQQINENDDKSESNDENSDCNRVRYQLVAVICHHGMSLSVGHYTSYIYSIENDQWFECDDNRVNKTDFDCVMKCSETSGYCYFYVLS